MSTPINPQPPAKKSWWKTRKGIAGIVGVLLIIGVINSCNTEDDSPEASDTTTMESTTVEETTVTEEPAAEETTPEEAPEEESLAGRTDEQKAADYEEWLKGQFGVESFTEILMEDSTLWAGWINGFEAKSDRMHVRLQIDRRDSDAKEFAKRASNAIASLIRNGNDPRVSNVDWVVVDDGAGDYLAQTSV